MTKKEALQIVVFFLGNYLEQTEFMNDPEYAEEVEAYKIMCKEVKRQQGG